MKKILLGLLFLFATSSLYSQTGIMPQGYSFEKVIQDAKGSTFTVVFTYWVNADSGTFNHLLIVKGINVFDRLTMMNGATVQGDVFQFLSSNGRFYADRMTFLPLDASYGTADFYKTSYFEFIDGAGQQRAIINPVVTLSSSVYFYISARDGYQNDSIIMEAPNIGLGHNRRTNFDAYSIFMTTGEIIWTDFGGGTHTYHAGVTISTVAYVYELRGINSPVYCPEGILLPDGTVIISTAGYGGFTSSSTARIPTIMVCGSDAPADMKAIANYVCDGIMDEVEIQNAINTYGKQSQINLMGHFNIDNNIYLTQSSMTLNGIGDVSLRYVDGATGVSVSSGIITATISVCNVSIKNINFDGNSANNTAVPNGGFGFYSWVGQSDITFDNCQFNNINTSAIRFHTQISTNITISNCQFNNIKEVSGGYTNSWFSIFVNYGVRVNIIENKFNNIEGAISITYGTNIIIKNNDMNNTSVMSGVIFYQDSSYLDISNNKIKNIKYASCSGIYSENNTNVNIAENQIYGYGTGAGFGIYAGVSNKANISGNICTNNGVGIDTIGSGMLDASISNNITCSNGVGIRVNYSGGVSRVSVVGNVSNSNNTYGFVDLFTGGTNITYSGNTAIGNGTANTSFTANPTVVLKTDEGNSWNATSFKVDGTNGVLTNPFDNTLLRSATIEAIIVVADLSKSSGTPVDVAQSSIAWSNNLKDTADLKASSVAWSNNLKDTADLKISSVAWSKDDVDLKASSIAWSNNLKDTADLKTSSVAWSLSDLNTAKTNVNNNFSTGQNFQSYVRVSSFSMNSPIIDVNGATYDVSVTTRQFILGTSSVPAVGETDFLPNSSLTTLNLISLCGFVEDPPTAAAIIANFYITNSANVAATLSVPINCSSGTLVNISSTVPSGVGMKMRITQGTTGNNFRIGGRYNINRGK